MSTRPLIGVLALQGGVAEHIAALERVDQIERTSGGTGLEIRPVKSPSDLSELDGVILPGGESSAVGKLLIDAGLLCPLRDRIREGLPAWGTCMGAILLAREIENDGRLHLGLMNITVRRNAYGGQLDSFRELCKIEETTSDPFPMVFIRAPVISSIGQNVQILAQMRGEIVACREAWMLATTFHPELTDDLRVHSLFLKMVNKTHTYGLG